MAAFAPMPRASEMIATAVTNGVLNSVRKASLRLAMVSWSEALAWTNDARLSFACPACVRVTAGMRARFQRQHACAGRTANTDSADFSGYTDDPEGPPRRAHARPGTW